MYDTHVDAFFNLTKKYQKPIIGYTYRSLQEPIVRDLVDRGVPIYKDPERAARAMAALASYHAIKGKIAEQSMEEQPFEDMLPRRRASVG